MVKFLQSSKKGWNDLSSSPRIIWEHWSWSKRGLWSKKSSLWKSDLNQRLVVFSHFASYSRWWMIYGSVRLWKLPIRWWRFIETLYWIISKYSQSCIMLVVQWPGLADDPIKPISEHNDGTEDLFISRDHVGGTSKLCKVWYTWRALQINLWSAQFQSSDWTPVPVSECQQLKSRLVLFDKSLWMVLFLWMNILTRTRSLINSELVYFFRKRWSVLSFLN